MNFSKITLSFFFLFVFISGCSDSDGCPDSEQYFLVPPFNKVLVLSEGIKGIKNIWVSSLSSGEKLVIYQDNQGIRGFQFNLAGEINFKKFLDISRKIVNIYQKEDRLYIVTYNNDNYSMNLYEFNLKDGNLSETIVNDFVPISGNVLALTLIGEKNHLFLVYVIDESVINIAELDNGKWKLYSITSDMYNGSGLVGDRVCAFYRKDILFISFLDRGSGKPVWGEYFNKQWNFVTVEKKNEDVFTTGFDVFLDDNNIPWIFYVSEYNKIFYSKETSTANEGVSFYTSSDYIVSIRGVIFNSNPYVFFYNGSKNYLGLLYRSYEDKTKLFYVDSIGMPGYHFDVNLTTEGYIDIAYWNAANGDIVFKEFYLNSVK